MVARHSFKNLLSNRNVEFLLFICIMMYFHNIFKFRSNITYLFKTILPSTIANAGTRTFGKKIEQGLFIELFLYVLLWSVLKKTVKCTLGVWYLPSCFFPLLYLSSFLIQLNNNKYTSMKKLYFYFFFLTVKGGFYTKFLERLKESFQERKSINNYRRKTAAWRFSLSERKNILPLTIVYW